MKGDLPEPAIAIETALTVAGLTIEVGSFDWVKGEPTLLATPDHTLSLLLSPRHRFAMGQFLTADVTGPAVEIGDILFTPAGLPFRSRSEGGPIRVARCRFAPDRFTALTGLDGPWSAATLAACLDIKNARIQELMVRLSQEALSPGWGAETLAHGLAEALAIELARHLRGLDAEAEVLSGGLAPWQFRRIRNHLGQASGPAPSITELAELCGISARHLTRLFKQSTRQTVHAYLRDQWIAKAKTLLGDTDMPLKEIATTLGYSDPGSFSMIFRRATGESPRTWRQQFRRGAG